MEKQALRQQGFHFLKALEQQPQRKQKREAVLYRQLFASSQWQQAETIGVVKSLAYELNTEPIIEGAFMEGKQVTVPKTLGQGRMAFGRITPTSSFTVSAFGVQEPLAFAEVAKAKLDLILVPGLVFSREGYRIGFGGGFYDRYLADFTGDTCSIFFKEQLIDSWQPEPFDIPVALLITDETRRNS